MRASVAAYRPGPGVALRWIRFVSTWGAQPLKRGISHVHRTHRSGWLRAAVLGANDGVVSTSSLIIGVASAQPDVRHVLIAGIAGLVAGMLSMGAGEYVSVSSQADTEKADLDVERRALDKHYDLELDELTNIYVERGLEPMLAANVAEQLMAYDALGAHARDDIGISDALTARPLAAAVASALSFAIGGMVPLIVPFVATSAALVPAIATVSLIFLVVLGVWSARMGGAPVISAAFRVLIWGALAMAITGLVGGFSDRLLQMAPALHR